LEENKSVEDNQGMAGRDKARLGKARPGEARRGKEFKDKLIKKE